METTKVLRKNADKELQRIAYSHIDTDQVIIAVCGTFKVKLSNDKNNKVFIFKSSRY